MADASVSVLPRLGPSVFVSWGREEWRVGGGEEFPLWPSRASLGNGLPLSEILRLLVV